MRITNSGRVDVRITNSQELVSVRLYSHDRATDVITAVVMMTIVMIVIIMTELRKTQTKKNERERKETKRSDRISEKQANVIEASTRNVKLYEILASE